VDSVGILPLLTFQQSHPGFPEIYCYNPDECSLLGMVSFLAFSLILSAKISAQIFFQKNVLNRVRFCQRHDRRVNTTKNVFTLAHKKLTGARKPKSAESRQSLFSILPGHEIYYRNNPATP
jgi:hypothetical protein